MNIAGIHLEVFQEIFRNRCNTQALIVVIINWTIVARQVELCSEFLIDVHADGRNPAAEIDRNGSIVLKPQR
jgi:hypothetical protein